MSYLSREEFAADRRRMMRLSVPELIALLSDERLRVRFLAEMCLRDATGV